jgi:hypothetical protein
MRKPAFAAIIDEKFDIKIFVDAAVCFETVAVKWRALVARHSSKPS